MGLFGSIYVGKSGVSSMSYGIGVTADNLANLESTGFRGSRPLFEDFFARATSEAPPYDQTGLGARVKDIQILYHGGPIKQTDQPSDLAISGKGFFVVSDGQEIFFTRDGQFIPQKVENDQIRLRLPTGYDLLGWLCPEGNCEDLTAGNLVPIEFPQHISGQATSKVILQMNLDAGKPPEESNLDLYDKWDATQPIPLPQGAYDFKVAVPIFDSLGNRYKLNLYFDRTSESRVFEFLAAVDPSFDSRGSGRWRGALMSGKIRFGSLGQIKSLEELTYITDPTGTRVSLGPNDFSAEGFPLLNLNLDDQLLKIALDFGIAFKQEEASWQRLDDHASTAFASPYAVINQSSDGYPPGDFETLSIDEKGIINVVYTNQKSFSLARIPLALFGDLDLLERAGANLFKARKNTTPQFFAPGRNAPGAIFGGALEQSNVDIANEMIHLITFQRTFQSNARIITTADQMLEDFLRQV